MLSNCSRRARTIRAVDPLPNAFAKIMVWIYNWIFDRKRKSVIWNGFESFTCEYKGPKLTLYRRRFTIRRYEGALTRLIQVRTTINCGWDNKIYYCGRTFHACASISMKLLLCWLAAGQAENKKHSTRRCRLDEDTPSSLTLSYQMKATNKWLYTCKYVLFLFSANSCDDNQLRSIISCFAHSAKKTVSCC